MENHGDDELNYPTQGYDINYKGLENDTGNNNCFLNVIIQSLWHLASFREHFMLTPEHNHTEEELNHRHTLSKTFSTNNMHSVDLLGIYEDANESAKKSELNNIVYEEPKYNTNGSSSTNLSYYEESKHNTNGSSSTNPITYVDGSFSYNREFSRNNSVLSIGNFKDICLYCNLKETFIKYHLENRESFVLTPQHIRTALTKLSGPADTQGFILGSMGCAEETFEEILGYLHRDSIVPKYIDLIRGNQELKFEVEFDADNLGCTPPCISHKVFGYQTYDLSYSFLLKLYSHCSACSQIDNDINDITNGYIFRLYVSEIMEKYEKKDNLVQVVGKTLGKDKYVKYYAKRCLGCGSAKAYKQKWCIQTPMVFTFALNWNTSEAETSTLNIIYSLIQPVIKLSDFFRFGAESDNGREYVLRGFVTYYGKHYIAYFYSIMHNTWIEFDDEHLRKIGNFDNVKQKCMRGRQQPVIIFYESIEVIKSLMALTPVDKINNASGYYFLENNMQFSNFWCEKQDESHHRHCNIF